MDSLSFFFSDLLENPLTLVTVVLGLLPVVLGVVYFVRSPRLFFLICKNLGRNRLRTALTCLAIMVLVFMVVVIWTVVLSLERFTQEKETNFKLIVSEKWSLPSMMPPHFADYLNPLNTSCILDRRDVGVQDFMTWSFYEGTTRKDLPPTPQTVVLFIVMEPDHIRPMMDDLEHFDEELVCKLRENLQGVVLGPERLAALNKRVGERFKVFGTDYQGIDLDVEVVGTLPAGRYSRDAIMNKAYLENALKKYHSDNKQAHPLADRQLNYVWLRVPDRAAFARVARQIETSPYLTQPEVKCETAASAISSFMEPYNDLLWAIEYLLVPVILVILALVIANAIGISVRERQQEIAVLKVLGFRPGQILVLVLGESMLVGALAGLVSAAMTFAVVNGMWGGLPLEFDELFPDFPVPVHALWWGLATGSLTALAGSVLPAWSASSVKPSEVFARVA
jgi:putative ABC transport system permease protein